MFILLLGDADKLTVTASLELQCHFMALRPAEGKLETRSHQKDARISCSCGSTSTAGGLIRIGQR